MTNFINILIKFNSKIQIEQINFIYNFESLKCNFNFYTIYGKVII